MPEISMCCGGFLSKLFRRKTSPQNLGFSEIDYSYTRRTLVVRRTSGLSDSYVHGNGNHHADRDSTLSLVYMDDTGLFIEPRDNRVKRVVDHEAMVGEWVGCTTENGLVDGVPIPSEDDYYHCYILNVPARKHNNSPAITAADFDDPTILQNCMMVHPRMTSIS